MTDCFWPMVTLSRKAIGELYGETDAELSRIEWIEERRAILEFEAGFPREQAEQMTVEMWEKRT